jgi:hypothetical protein
MRDHNGRQGLSKVKLSPRLDGGVGCGHLLRGATALNHQQCNIHVCCVRATRMNSDCRASQLYQLNFPTTDSRVLNHPRNS